ncbi:MAG: autotransporter-associated beta strand repeat-containing protein [Verrucomicrobiae bacterium]|nr:autotransporter-associated beta strand repeat-containing protein [Verrucomicrobiae bacterium]
MKTRIVFLLAISLSLASVLPVLAATDTWSGGAAPDGNWSNAANWDMAPAAGDFLTFDNGSGTQPLTTNNLAAGTIFGNIAFNAGTASFTDSGNGIVLTNRLQDANGVLFGGSVSNLSANAQTVNLPVTIGAGNHIVTTASGAGALDFSGAFARNTGATVQFVKSGGNLNFTGSGLANVNSILGGWAVLGGTDYAALDGSQNVVAPGYTSVNSGAIANGATVNYTSSGSGTLTANNVSINSLRAAFSSSSRNLNITGTLTVSAGGGIFRNTASSGTLTVSGGTLTCGATGGGGEMTFINLNSDSAKLIIGTTVADNGGGAVKVNELGSLNWNNNNTYSGGTCINYGDCYLNGSSVRLGTGPVYVYPGGRFDAGGANGATFANNFFIAGTGYLSTFNSSIYQGAIKGSYNGTFSGLITLISDAQIDPNAGGLPNTCTFSGGFAGTGSLTIGGPANLTAGNATFGGNCTYTGNTIIDASANANGGAGIIISSGKNNILNNGGNINLIGGSSGIALLDLNGTTQTINGLASPSGNTANAIVKSSAAGAVLVAGSNNTSSTFSGGIQNGSGTVGVTKVGTGTLVLNGVNTFTGPTVVSNGVLSIGNSLVSSQVFVASPGVLDVSPLGTFNLSGGQTLGGNGAVNGSISAASGSIISPGFGPGTLMLSNDLTLATGSVCYLELSATTNGANDRIVVNGNLNLSGGTIQISSGSLQQGRYKLITYAGAESGTAAANLVLSYAGSQGVSLDDSIAGEIDLLVSSAFVTKLTWEGDGSQNLWDITATANWLNGASPSTYSNSTAITFNDSGSKSPDVNITATVQPLSLLVSNNTGTYTFSGGGNIAGGTTLIKKGFGALVLNDTGGDTFSGGVLVQGGSVTFSNRSMNISGGLTVTNGSATVANNGAIAGNLTVQAGGLVVLDQVSDATFTGNTFISNGAALQLGNNDATGVLPSGTITANGSLNFDQTADNTVGNNISGTGTLNKNTNTVLTLTGANSFAGNVNVNAGTLQSALASGLGVLGSGTITIANGATLDKGTDEVKPIVASGTGATGDGAIVNFTGNPIYDGNGGLTPSLTLTGNLKFGGNTRQDLGGPSGAMLSTGGNNYNLVISNSNYVEWQHLTVDTNLGNIDIMMAYFGLKGCGAGLGNPTNTITVHTGAELQFWGDGSGGANSGYNKEIHVQTGATISFRPENPNVYYNCPLTLDDGSTWNMFNGSGTTGTVLMGPVTLNGLAHLQIGDSACTVSNVISGPGGFYWDNFNNAMTFTATNTYQGVTDIRAGRTLTLRGGGSIAQSSNLILAATATLTAITRTDGTLTLAAGQTLNGNGTVDGNLAVGAGATILPGDLGNIGETTVTNGSLTLAGLALMKLDSTLLSNDVLLAASPSASINFGGTLTVTTLAGTPALGSSFTLFSAPSYAGNFAATNLPALDTGLAWNWNPANGTLSVVPSVNQNPTNIAFSVSGDVLTLSWPADHTGWRLQAQTNSLNTGLGTNWYDVAGATSVNSVNITNNAADSAVFFRMVYP